MTDSFIQHLQQSNDRLTEYNWLTLPTKDYAPYFPGDIDRWLSNNYTSVMDAPPIIFICFSAGVVGGLGAALWWQHQGGKIGAFFALDGWGVPIVANFPVYRLSHDYFTHWSSALLGSSRDSFYADPAVTHLDLWRYPHQIEGWWVSSSGKQKYCSLTEFLNIFIFLQNIY